MQSQGNERQKGGHRPVGRVTDRIGRKGKDGRGVLWIGSCGKGRQGLPRYRRARIGRDRWAGNAAQGCGADRQMRMG